MPAVFDQNVTASAEMLRRVAARDLQLDHKMENGTVDEYNDLTPDEQVALTDEMARLIVQYPDGWSVEIYNSALARIQAKYYGQPLEDTSETHELIRQIASGEFWKHMKEGGTDYLKWIGIAAAGVYLLIEVPKYIGRGKKNGN